MPRRRKGPADVRFGAPRVMVVTARHRLAAEWTGSGRDWQTLLGEQVRGAILGGADLVHVREPDLDAGPLAAFLRAMFAELPECRTRVVVNERLDVAWAVKAAGVHLPERSLTTAQARALLPAEDGWVVGRSVHTVGAARASAGASYVLGGTVLPSASKAPGAQNIGWTGLRALVDAASGIPVVAIGGLTERHVPQVLAAGATGVAAIGYFIPRGHGDIAACVQDRVRRMRLAFDTPGSVSYTQWSDH